ncbi:MAG: PAC2 family protein [Thaumarchaeota archaeon]|nr:PAC2 family protein [Nitrososphaerota archaeon]
MPSEKVPVLICGMPDTGYVGRLAPYYLTQALKASTIAELYSKYFPAQIQIYKDGTTGLLKGELFWSKDTNLLIFTGDSQAATPEGQHVVSEKIVKIGSELGVKKVFTLGAFITGAMVKDPSVYGTATSPELLGELRVHNVKTMSEGAITGMNGLLFGLAKMYGMDSVGLYGETSGFGADEKAAKAILKVLEKILNVALDYSAIKPDKTVLSGEDQNPESEEGHNNDRGYIR